MGMTFDSTIEWKSPDPERPNGNIHAVDHARVALKLCAAPGRWARIKAYRNAATATSIAWQIRNGALVAYAPKGTYEATRRSEEGAYWVYARYVGPGSEGE